MIMHLLIYHFVPDLMNYKENDKFDSYVQLSYDILT